MTTPINEEYMREALELAKRGRGRVEPNPMVGCVIVKDRRIVGRGYHHKFGEAHAEVEALREAGAAAEGADVYVTLEPCAHYGKTPPCTEALIETKVGRVIIAKGDVNPKTAGLGIQRLREAGIEAVSGVLETEARELNAPYIKLMTKGLSYVTAKWAMSLDGKIATYSGDSRWISCDESRRIVHQLRNEVDAVMVGVGTVLVDDPLLTCRIPGGRSPRRIIVDSTARIPVFSNIVQTAADIPTFVAVTDAAPAERLEQLKDTGCIILKMPANDGRVCIGSLVAETGRLQLTNILVESGGTLLASAIEEKVVDEVKVFVAPLLIGGKNAHTAVAGTGFATIAESLRLKKITFRPVGNDVLIEGRL